MAAVPIALDFLPSANSNHLDASPQTFDSNELTIPTTCEKIGLRDRISHFTWPWFSSTMSTGSLAVVIGLNPYQFQGLHTIGTIFFVVDLVFFLAFVCAMTTRFILDPSKLLASLHHPVESLFFGSFWVSISLILTSTQIYGVPHCGPWLVKALQICFWLYCALALLVAIFQFFAFFNKEMFKVEDAVPAWVFPVYPLVLVGPMAGELLASQPPEATVSMWIGAVMLQGLGWTVTLSLYTIYLERLLTGSLPSPPTRPGMFISVGPPGYTAAALISLGVQAPAALPRDLFGATNADLGGTLKIIGIICGIFLILFAFWFFAISTAAVIGGLRRMQFTLNWWAFVFPIAGFALAVIQLGSALESEGINAVASAITILLVIMWLITAAAHIRALWLCQILWPGKDEDKDIKQDTKIS